jgi:hypothetical protein
MTDIESHLPAAELPVNTTRLALISALGAVAFAGLAFLFVFWDEILLAAPIIFLVKVLGFWPAVAAFTITWATMNVFSLTLFDHAWERIKPTLASYIRSLKHALRMRVDDPPAHKDDSAEKEKHQGWRMAVVMWLANIFRPLGAIATGVFLGGPFGVAMYRVLGYKGWHGYAWTLGMTPVYGLIWVSFYGQGGVAVMDQINGII